MVWDLWVGSKENGASVRYYLRIPLNSVEFTNVHLSGEVPHLECRDLADVEVDSCRS